MTVHLGMQALLQGKRLLDCMDVLAMIWCPCSGSPQSEAQGVGRRKPTSNQKSGET